jgi:hypothetical protein
MNNGNPGKSEVARLLQQIEQEYQAAQRGLTGPAAGVSQHQFITARMENMGHCHKALTTLVGDEQATKMVAETLERL